MAQATPRTVAKTVEVKEQDGSIDLVLTKEEAETLAEVMYKIAGSPYSSRRGHMQRLGEALRSAGVLNPADASYVSDLLNSSEGSIKFADLPDGDPALKGLDPDPFKDVVNDVFGTRFPRPSRY